MRLKNRLVVSCCLGALLGILVVVAPLLPVISKYGGAEDSRLYSIPEALDTARAEGYFDGDGLPGEVPRIYAFAVLFTGCLFGFLAFRIAKGYWK